LLLAGVLVNEMEYKKAFEYCDECEKAIESFYGVTSIEFAKLRSFQS
jgi:hypothetical protein